MAAALFRSCGGGAARFLPICRRYRVVYFCSAASTESVVQPAAAAHSWPEWDLLVEKLRSKGYFDRPRRDGADAGSSELRSREVERLKDGVVKFGRDRYDLLGSLPKEEIRAVVQSGCPIIQRKAVNSSKRLRAFLQLDEEEVCSDCKLRGSCDKAYLSASDDEARTVDIVRILATYAINSTNISEEEYCIDADVRESAKKLLSKLAELSDTPIDPSVPVPVFNSIKKEPSVKETKHPNGRDGKYSEVEMKKGDWLCPSCNFLNFARNIRCLECKQDGPKKVDFGRTEMKSGDWTCPKCEFMNFARNNKCFRCQEVRPKRVLQYGEWECPSCDFVNFRRNRACLKCKIERPGVDEDCYERAPGVPTRKPEGYEGRWSVPDDDEDEDDGSEDSNSFPLKGRKSLYRA